MTELEIAIACILVAACGSSGSKPPGPDAPMGPSTAVGVAGDYTAGDPGIMAAVDVDTRTVTKNVAPQGAVGDDPMVRQFGSELFVVNRADGNNVTILDAKTFALVEQLSTGAGSNPQDVALRGNQLFVPVFAGKGVAVLTRGSQTIDMIDLSADDPDGKPDCVSAYFVGNSLYVACELLDDTNQNLPPRGRGKVYVVDPDTHQRTQTITMMNPNPLGIFEPLPSGDLAIPTVDYNTMGGCVEQITTGATPASGGCITTNMQLNGYASGLAAQVAGTSMVLWHAVSQFDFTHANLQGFDLGTKMLWPDPITPASELVEAVAVCPDASTVVTDGTMAASGVRIYNSATELTTSALDIGLRTQNANAIACY